MSHADEQSFAEIAALSNFSFLRGASHPEELVAAAAALGYRGLAITDWHSFAGIVRAHTAAKEVRLPLAVGCRLPLTVGQEQIDVLAYPSDRESYGRLCRLLTTGKRRSEKGACQLHMSDLLDHQAGVLIVMPLPDRLEETTVETYRTLCSTFDDDRFSLAVSVRHDGRDESRLRHAMKLADHLRVPLAASNDVFYHIPARRPLQDVLTCIREHRTIDTAGFLLEANSERHLKSPVEMSRLFARYPQAVARSVEIVARSAAFSLDELRYQYPHETCPPNVSPMQYLRDLTYAGAADRYSHGLPDEVRSRIEHELQLIDELNYPHYFLTVHDLVRFARSRGIVCQGRGAAANSAVCYCLGVTSVDPAQIDLLFERFVSRERNEPPDIDIDFEHERREEVIQYVYGKYGRNRAAITAEVICYRRRSAMREVGKALGLSTDAVDRVARSFEWFDSSQDAAAKLRLLGFDPADPTMRQLVELSGQLQGFPRHLSQHVGGFVISDRPLYESVPIENAAMEDRTIIEWDKDDIDAVGMMKVDCLALGMLTAVRKAMGLIEQHHDRPLELHTIPIGDPVVYDMLCDADAVGVFQVESRAQRAMLPRLRPRCYYDLVIEVAIVRPGPIVGDIVHPYLRRRDGKEPVTYPDALVKRVLGRTLGVPLFQEQAMSLAMGCAGFSADEADRLRRAIAAWKRKQHVISEFQQRIIEGMTSRGYPERFAQQCFDRMKGFSEYGFPESHAASFALIVYVSAWLKRHYPAAFTAALLNSQPMGFYAPAQLVRDAQEHSVQVRPIDVNHSQWDCTLEDADDGGKALRLGMRLAKGLKKPDAQRIVAAVAVRGCFGTIDQVWRHSGATARAMRKLAQADAFGSMRLDRQQALWQVRQLRDEDLPLFDGKGTENEAWAPLPDVMPVRQVTQDYAAVGLSLKRHPMSFLREQLDRRYVVRCEQLSDPAVCPTNSRVSVAGLCIGRQRPSTPSDVIFVTLEDETGVANLIVWPKVLERYRTLVLHRSVMLVTGILQRDDSGKVIHILARKFSPIHPPQTGLTVHSRDFH